MLIFALFSSGLTETLPDTMQTSIWSFSLARLKATMADMGNAPSSFHAALLRQAESGRQKARAAGSADFIPGVSGMPMKKQGILLIATLDCWAFKPEYQHEHA